MGFQIVKGPTGGDNFYLLAALSDLRDVMEVCVGDVKEKEKGEGGRKKSGEGGMERGKKGISGAADLPVYLREVERRPNVNIQTIRKDQKKVEFYLAWSKQFYNQFQLLSNEKI